MRMLGVGQDIDGVVRHRCQGDLGDLLQRGERPMCLSEDPGKDPVAHRSLKRPPPDPGGVGQQHLEGVEGPSLVGVPPQGLQRWVVSLEGRLESLDRESKDLLGELEAGPRLDSGIGREGRRARRPVDDRHRLALLQVLEDKRAHDVGQRDDLARAHLSRQGDLRQRAVEHLCDALGHDRARLGVALDVVRQPGEDDAPHGALRQVAAPEAAPVMAASRPINRTATLLVGSDGVHRLLAAPARGPVDEGAPVAVEEGHEGSAGVRHRLQCPRPDLDTFSVPRHAPVVGQREVVPGFEHHCHPYSLLLSLVL